MAMQQIYGPRPSNRTTAGMFSENAFAVTRRIPEPELQEFAGVGIAASIERRGRKSFFTITGLEHRIVERGAQGLDTEQEEHALRILRAATHRD